MIVAYVQSRPNTADVAVAGAFNGERAFADLKRLVGFGPRPAGSPALERTREFIVNGLHVSGVPVTEDRFPASTQIGPIPNGESDRQDSGFIPLGDHSRRPLRYQAHDRAVPRGQ